MPAPVSEPAAVPAAPSLFRRLWRWVRWLLLAGLVLALLLGIFHRALILWTLNRYAPDFAKKVPLALKWQVEGSLWHDLSLSNVEASSDDDAMPLRSLKLGYLEVKHDLAPAWSGDYYSIAKSVVLHDMEAVIDLRHPKPAAHASDKAVSDPQALVDLLKQLKLPALELKNLSITVLQPEATLKINGLDLTWPAGQPGTLHIASIEHPALAQYPLHDVTATLTLNGPVFTIEALKLPPQIEVEQLKADLSHYGKKEVAATTRVRSGEAVIALDAKADLRDAGPLVDATVDITGLNEKEIARWVKNPPPAQARVQRLHITANGDPMKPRSFAATVSLDVRDLAYQAYRAESVTLETRLAEGKLSLSPLSVSVGGNTFVVTTEADAPSEWTGMTHTPLLLKWKLAAPTLQSIAGLPVKVSGALKGEGTVELNDNGLKGFSAKLEGQALAADGNALRSLTAEASGDLKTINYSVQAEAEAGDGQLSTQGLLALESGTQSQVEWTLLVPKVLEFAKALKITLPAEADVGEVRSKGWAKFDLAKVKAADLNDVLSSGELNVKQPAWKGAACQQLSASWRLEKGLASPTLRLDITPDNYLTLTGRLALGGEQDFDGTLDLHLPDLAALRPQLDAAGAKALQSGQVQFSWTGHGKLKDLSSIQGRADATIEQLHYETLPEALALKTSFTHTLEKADFEKFAGAFGPWQVEFFGSASKTQVALNNLSVSHKARQLLLGSVQVPLDLNTKPVPVSADKPLSIVLQTVEKIAFKDLAVLAKQPLPPDLAGTLDLEMKLGGTLPKLAADIRVMADDLKLPKTPVTKDTGRVLLTLALHEGALKLNTDASVPPLQPLTVAVASKVDVMALINNPQQALETPFDASVKLNQPTLDFLKPLAPMLTDFRGSLNLDVKASGTAKAPHVNGGLTLELPLVTPKDPDLPTVKDFKAQITAEDTLVRLKTLHAIAAGGVLDLSGSCDLKDMQRPAFDISLTARDLLAVRNDMMTLRTDADLRCKGVPTAASVTGSIALTRGRVFQEINFLPLNKMMNDLPPLPDEKANKPVQATEAKGSDSPLPPMLKDWTFDLAVKTKDDIRLLGNVVNGGVKIDLKLGGNGAKPSVLGDVTTERAVLNLPFSTLRIRDGIVHFGPETPLMEPSLQLLAESTVDAYEINLRGYGNVKDPKIHFTSTPPLPEGEIAMLLATGTTTSGLKTGGGDTAGRAALFLVREAYRRMFISKNSNKKKEGKEDESRFIVQERSEDGKLGGVTGIYEISRKMKIIGSTDKDGGFRAMLHYLFKFD